MAFDWRELGATPPSDLVEARLQLHYAAQIVSSVGFTFVSAKPDWSHTSLEWSAELNALASRATAGEKPYRAALIFPSFELALLDGDSVPVARCALKGRNVDGGYAWLAGAIADYQVRPLDKELFRPEHELPPYLGAEGDPFPFAPRPAFAELANWYAAGANLLAEIRAAEENASPLVVWPHHFDMATLITLSGEGESATTIGVGLSPGDGSYAEPYWYVSPWPTPETEDRPALEGGGNWHTEGFTAAVLPASRMNKSGAAPTRAFLRSALAACRKLLLV